MVILVLWLGFITEVLPRPDREGFEWGSSHVEGKPCVEIEKQ
jgi:hypothetical protein